MTIYFLIMPMMDKNAFSSSNENRSETFIRLAQGVFVLDTGCSLIIVFFFEDIKIYSKLCFPMLSVCVHRTSCRAARWQVDRHRTGRVKKKSQILRKNTIFTEHPVPQVFTI